jgi:hypothetical protein
MATARQEIADLESGRTQYSDIRDGKMVVINDQLLANAKSRVEICERLLTRYRTRNSQVTGAVIDQW